MHSLPTEAQPNYTGVAAAWLQWLHSAPCVHRHCSLFQIAVPVVLVSSIFGPTLIDRVCAKISFGTETLYVQPTTDEYASLRHRRLRLPRSAGQCSAVQCSAVQCIALRHPLPICTSACADKRRVPSSHFTAFTNASHRIPPTPQSVNRQCRLCAQQYVHCRTIAESHSCAAAAHYQALRTSAHRRTATRVREYTVGSYSACDGSHGQPNRVSLRQLRRVVDGRPALRRHGAAANR